MPFNLIQFSLALQHKMTNWEYCERLITHRTTCDECNGDLVLSNDDPAEVTLYTREGTKYAQHYHKECPNRWCRKTFFHGYSVKKDTKVYDSMNHQTKVLVISQETAFSTDFCYELTLHVLHNNASFQGYADVYNQLHNYNNAGIKRADVNRKRVATAFFLYGFLEFTSRNKILHEFKVGDNWLEDTILDYYSVIKEHFSNHWTDKHTCSVSNCTTMMVSDGGMKINRKVCGAKFSAVRKFSNTGKAILTGCTASPVPDSPFCSKHVHAESPVVLVENLSRTTKERLRDFRTKHQKSNLQLPNDSVYIIQAVHSSRISKKNIEFSVQFAGFPDSILCWEPAKVLPKFIVDFYSDPKNLKKQIPGPRVLKTTKLKNGTEMYVELVWDPKDSTKEILELDENLFDIDADKLCEDELKSSCNTRKTKDKRDRRHTAGILISCKPCGIIPHVDELFGSESIKQVHESIIEFLGTVKSETRKSLKLWLYDDMCHLKPYSEKLQNRETSDFSEMFASLSKAVDKFHFVGHKKTDIYCQENCNPKTELMKLNMGDVNSPACEQAFKWINSFTNLKSMNESRFKFFLVYLIDLHNLHIEGKVSLLANPLNENREVEILANTIQLIDLDQKCTQETQTLNIEKEMCKTSVTLEDCYNTDKDGQLSCKFCEGKYTRVGHMKNHCETKHNIIIDLICKCGQLFNDTTRYSRHKKSCKK